MKKRSSSKMLGVFFLKENSQMTYKMTNIEMVYML